MEIVKVGTFINGGFPDGWTIIPSCGEVIDPESPALELEENGDVLIGGILMRELTEERKSFM